MNAAELSCIVGELDLIYRNLHQIKFSGLMPPSPSLLARSAPDAGAEVDSDLDEACLADAANNLNSQIYIQQEDQSIVLEANMEPDNEFNGSGRNRIAWEEVYHAGSGHMYYYHHDTGVSQWEEPNAPYIAMSSAGGWFAWPAHADEGAAETSDAVLRPVTPPLPRASSGLLSRADIAAQFYEGLNRP